VTNLSVILYIEIVLTAWHVAEQMLSVVEAQEI